MNLGPLRGGHSNGGVPAGHWEWAQPKVAEVSELL